MLQLIGDWYERVQKAYDVHLHDQAVDPTGENYKPSGPGNSPGLHLVYLAWRGDCLFVVLTPLGESRRFC